MNLVGIGPGDVLVFDPRRAPQHGDIVIADVEDHGTTVKRLRQARAGRGLPGRAWLVPESTDPRWRPTLIDNRVRLLGVVVGIDWGGRGDIDEAIPRRPARSMPQLEAELVVPQAVPEGELSALAEHLLKAMASVPGMGYADFARAIGIDEFMLGVILEGHVPEPKVQDRIASRLEHLKTRGAEAAFF